MNEETEQMDLQVYNYPPGAEGEFKLLALGSGSSLARFLIELNPANSTVNVLIDVGVEDEQVPEVIGDVIQLLQQVLDGYEELS